MLKKLNKINWKVFNTLKMRSVLFPIVFILMIGFLLILNIKFIGANQYNFNQIFKVLNNWNSINIEGLNQADVKIIMKGLYSVGATFVAGVGMTLAAIATQSITKNPIAEGSTLGLVQSSIFGIVFIISMGLTTLIMKYIFAIIFAFICSLLLIMFIFFSKKNNSGLPRIILAGLAIGIIFKTLTFIFKKGDTNLNSVSYSYVLGGAESIANNSNALYFDSMHITLLVSTILILIALFILIINIKGMNLLEIGNERAKNLGSSIRRTKILNVISIILALPAAVIIVGNMAFLGLFAVQGGRWLAKSRNYKIVLPLSLLLGIFMANFGMWLTELIPQVNSGIWMTFIGAPYLIYIGIKGIK